MFMNESMLDAYAQNKTEQVMSCFIRLPEEKYGRFVQFKVNLLTGPEAGEIIGILTVTDITEETISERIFHQLSVTSHDFVVDVDLLHDSYAILACNENASYIPALHGCHSRQTAEMADSIVLPKDSRQFRHALEADEIRRSLKKGPYTFTFSTENHGDIRIKNMTIASIEPLLERYCMVCTDITDSVREQQGLLHMMAYTFELMGLLDVGSGSVTVYTRNMVLENLPPDTTEDYAEAVRTFTDPLRMCKFNSGWKRFFSDWSKNLQAMILLLPVWERRGFGISSSACFGETGTTIPSVWSGLTSRT